MLDRSRALLLALVCATACGGSPDTPDEPAPPVATPAAGTNQVASADGVPISYSVEGTGPTALVFIHDWAADRGYWEHQVDVFAPDYTVVTLDLAGHGRSGATRERWSWDAYADDVAAVVNALDLDRVVLVGHSMGGLVALLAAPKLPGRVIGVVPVQAVLNAEFMLPPEAWKNQIDTFSVEYGAKCATLAATRFVAGSDPELVQRVTADICAKEPDLLLRQLRIFPELNQPEALAGVDVPIRSINSDKSVTKEDVNKKYAKDIETRYVYGVGHYVMLENPTSFNEKLAEILVEVQF